MISLSDLVSKTTLAITGAAIALTASFALGANYERLKNERRKSKVEIEALNTQVAQMAIITETLNKQSQFNDQLTARFVAEVGGLRDVSSELKGKINELSEASSSISLSIGAMRLLNDARTGTVSADPATSGDSAYSDSSASDFRLIDLINSGVETATAYNLARAQCNRLIEWHKSQK